MSLSTYLWTMRLSTLLALIVFLFVLFQVDPEQSGWVGQAFLYGSLFFVLSGIFILFFSWLRRVSQGADNVMNHLGMSFRQGVLLAVLTEVLLYMQSFRVLTWWDGLLVVAAIFLIELYFLAKPSRT